MKEILRSVERDENLYISLQENNIIALYKYKIFIDRNLVWLVPLFNGISTFVGYLMPNLFS